MRTTITSPRGSAPRPGWRFRRPWRRRNARRIRFQFLLRGFDSDEEARAFQAAADRRGVSVQVFGLSRDNARAFWNWQFLGDLPELPKTRAMLMRAGDLRLPARLKRGDLDFIADALLAAAAEVKDG